ncbi:MAG TPA: tetratricopeptide repeat protein, partial [Myxococcota bacterium]
MICLRPELPRPRTAAAIGVLLAFAAGCAEPSQDPLQEARRLYESGQYTEALAELRPLEAAQAGIPEFDLLYARVLIDTRRPNLAREPLERAAASPAHAFEASILLATALLRADEFQDALEAADRALALEPGDSTAWQLRGRANLAMGQNREALADIERAIELDPDTQSHSLTRVLVLLSLGRFDEATAVLNQAKRRLEEAPDPSRQVAASLCVAEARLVLGTGDPADAGAQIDRCVERFPANPFVVGEALDLFDSLEQPERAMRVLRGAIEAWPEHPRY